MPETKQEPVPVLSDDEVAGIEARNKSGRYPFIKTVDALCATVRALREKHTQLAEVSGEWAKLLDRIRLWSKCADGYPLDEHINNIATQLAQVTQERQIAVRYLSKQGFARCDQPEHGCGGWHERLTP